MNVATPEGMAFAIAWTKAHLARINEGGIWFVPRVCSEYEISHKNKTATRRGLMSDPAITKVLTAMGWTVIEKENP
jgi:hypothetical protein